MIALSHEPVAKLSCRTCGHSNSHHETCDVSWIAEDGTRQWCNCPNGFYEAAAVDALLAAKDEEIVERGKSIVYCNEVIDRRNAEIAGLYRAITVHIGQQQKLLDEIARLNVECEWSAEERVKLERSIEEALQLDGTCSTLNQLVGAMIDYRMENDPLAEIGRLAVITHRKSTPTTQELGRLHIASWDAMIAAIDAYLANKEKDNGNT
jgi:hypothetical protein